MTYLNDKAQSFNTIAKKRSEFANLIYDAQTSCYGSEEEKTTLLETPYLNTKYHFDALWYPLYNFINLLLDVARLVMGIFLFMWSLFESNEKAQKLIGEGILHEACAVGFDLMNTCVSFVSLISRTVSSIINGYAADMAKERTYNELKENGIPSFFAKVGAGVAKAGAYVNLLPIEEKIRYITFQF